MIDIKWVIFDLGGIVVPESKGILAKKEGLTVKEIAEYLNISVSQFQELTEEYMHQVTTGDITLFGFYSILIERLKVSVSPENVLKKHISIFRKASTRQDSDIIHIIDLLKKDYNVGCLTNTEIEIADVNRTTGLFEYFQKAYLSTEIGLRKPNMDIYHFLLADLNCSPQAVVFIDDKHENVESAKRIGINAIQFITVKQLQSDLSYYCNFMN